MLYAAILTAAIAADPLQSPPEAEAKLAALDRLAKALADAKPEVPAEAKLAALDRFTNALADHRKINAPDPNDPLVRYAAKCRKATGREFLWRAGTLKDVMDGSIRRSLRLDSDILPGAVGKPLRYLFKTREIKERAILQSKLNVLVLNIEPLLPPLPNSFKTGDIGALTLPGGLVNAANVVEASGVLEDPVGWHKLEVRQVIDESNMLVDILDLLDKDGVGQRTSVWLKTPTAGITDGKVFNPADGDAKIFNLTDMAFRVTGTTTYQNVIGGTRTVHVLEDVSQAVALLGPFIPVNTTAELDEFMKLPVSEWEKRVEGGDAEVADAAAQADDENESRAARALGAIEKIIARGDKALAKGHLERLIERYPATEAAGKAKQLLKEL